MKTIDITTATNRAAVIAVVGAVAFGVIVLRLWAMTVISGSSYAQLAVSNQTRRIPVEAPRGKIVDRNGHVLVTNRAAREVVVDIHDVPRSQRKTVYNRLAHLLGVSNADMRETIALGQKRDPLSPVVVASDEVKDDVVFYLEEHPELFPGVSVSGRYVRDYVHGTLAAHVLGQVGEVSSKELKGEYSNLKPGDHVGQSGLERTYDQYLRGVDGYDSIEVNASGIPQGIARGVPPTPGRTLRLSIDLGLEKTTERALREGIQIAHSAGKRSANAAAAVALDPRNGHVLSIASYPTFNPNIFVTPNRKNNAKITALLHNTGHPLDDRAIAGLYPSGSTFKVFTAIAALQQRFLTPSSELECPGFMNIRGTRFNNWTTESMGSMDLDQALEESCDTFFYQLGLDFYDMPGHKLQNWAGQFGLGKLTGIDLPGESAGVVPTPKWMENTFSGVDGSWKPGDSANLSIGQGNLLVTPLQMADAYAAIANGGTLYQPRIGEQIDDASGKTVQKLATGTAYKVPVSQANLNAVRNGLYMVNNGPEGTATAVFSGFPIPTAGKTGTAEKPGTGDMAWYCGFAPYNHPTIAACAMVERGGEGGVAAAPIVLRIFQHYFGVKGGQVVTDNHSD